MQKTAPKLLFVVNIPRFFLSHRLPLALAARDAGYADACRRVHCRSIVGAADTGRGFGLPSLAPQPARAQSHSRTAYRSGRCAGSISSSSRNLIHHVSIKPILYGGIAARLAGSPRVVHAISGLGYLFVSRDIRARLLRVLCQPALRTALAGANTRMIFQNRDDRRVFLQRGLVDESRTVLIRGSGVDEEEFSPRERQPGAKPVVLFAGRLLWRKGIADFVEVARRLRDRAHFRVAGYEEETSPLNVAATPITSLG